MHRPKSKLLVSFLLRVAEKSFILIFSKAARVQTFQNMIMIQCMKGENVLQIVQISFEGLFLFLLSSLSPLTLMYNTIISYVGIAGQNSMCVFLFPGSLARHYRSTHYQLKCILIFTFNPNFL